MELGKETKTSEMELGKETKTIKLYFSRERRLLPSHRPPSIHQRSSVAKG